MLPSKIDEPFLLTLLDSLPEPVVYHVPVWKESNGIKTIVDFKIIYCNEESARMTGIQKKILIGQRVTTMIASDPGVRAKLFEQIMHVYSTGDDAEFSYYNPVLKKHFHLLRKKIEDGVYTIGHKLTPEIQFRQETERQTELANSIFDASLNGVYAMEAVRNDSNKIIDFVFIKVNKRFADLLGKSVEEIIGERYLSLFSSSIENRLFYLQCQVVYTGQPVQTEINYKGPGINGWFNISVTKLGVNGIVETFTDITEIKKNKEASENAAAKLHTIINTSQAGVFMGSPVKDEEGEIVDFRFTMANQALAFFTGQPVDKLIGELGSRWFARYKTNGLFDILKETFETGNSKRFDFYYEGYSAVAWVNIMTTKLEDEVLGTFTDYTPVKLLQQEVEQSAEHLRTVINSAQAGMFSLSPVKNGNNEIVDFRFGVVNEAVAKYVGEKSDTLAGALASEYFPAYKQNGLFGIYKDTFRTGNVAHFDYHFEDGFDKYFNIHVVKMSGEVLVTFTDQTSLKKLQKDLEANVEELKRSNANLEEFAYAASHDLKEPIRKIQIFSDLLKRSLVTRLDNEEKSVFERMETASKRMGLLVDDLLEYSHVSRGIDFLEDIDLNEKVELVLGDLELIIQEKNANIVVEKLPTIKGHRRQMQQLFLNLIANALKYKKPGIDPEIIIRSKIVTGAESHMGFPREAAGKKFYLIEVADNGIGFEQSEVGRIFNVFQRLHGNNEYNGTGVGLSIARKVVENHNGYITAQSEPGTGAIFKVFLPV